MIVGARIKIYGLESEKGKKLNGRHGRIIKKADATGRYGVAIDTYRDRWFGLELESVDSASDKSSKGALGIPVTKLRTFRLKKSNLEMVQFVHGRYVHKEYETLYLSAISRHLDVLQRCVLDKVFEAASIANLYGYVKDSEGKLKITDQVSILSTGSTQEGTKYSTALVPHGQKCLITSLQHIAVRSLAQSLAVYPNEQPLKVGQLSRDQVLKKSQISFPQYDLSLVPEQFHTSLRAEIAHIEIERRQFDLNTRKWKSFRSFFEETEAGSDVYKNLYKLCSIAWQDHQTQWCGKCACELNTTVDDPHQWERLYGHFGSHFGLSFSEHIISPCAGVCRSCGRKRDYAHLCLSCAPETCEYPDCKQPQLAPCRLCGVLQPYIKEIGLYEELQKELDGLVASGEPGDDRMSHASSDLKDMLKCPHTFDGFEQVKAQVTKRKDKLATIKKASLGLYECPDIENTTKRRKGTSSDLSRAEAAILDAEETTWHLFFDFLSSGLNWGFKHVSSLAKYCNPHTLAWVRLGEERYDFCRVCRVQMVPRRIGYQLVEDNLFVYEEKVISNRYLDNSRFEGCNGYEFMLDCVRIRRSRSRIDIREEDLVPTLTDAEKEILEPFKQCLCRHHEDESRTWSRSNQDPKTGYLCISCAPSENGSFCIRKRKNDKQSFLLCDDCEMVLETL